MKPAVFAHPDFPGYSLIDSGGGEKLEQFGEVVLRRPDPQALWRRRRGADVWKAADLTFVRELESGGKGGHWVAGDDPHFAALREEPQWPVRFRDTRAIVRPTPFKHVGLFPEQACNWNYVAKAASFLDVEKPKLLNLFGYTGIASISAAQAGFEVTHVDASKSAIAWTLENAQASGLGNEPFRTICDDALAFACREVRRGSRYQGILLDPPQYGRGPKGEKWQFEDSIALLVEAASQILAERSFLILSAYAIGYSPLAFLNLLTDMEGGEVAAGDLALPEAGPEDERRLLPAGFCARWQRGIDGISPAS